MELIIRKVSQINNFNNNGYLYYFLNLLSIFSTKNFQGWGKKKTGRFALWCHKTFGGEVTLFEDGFIRSIELGINGSPSFSRVEDDIGIYYDATVPSKLENILNTYDFTSDTKLMQTATEAMHLIKKHHISKYNNAPDVDETFLMKYGLDPRVKPEDDGGSVLIIAQTAGDASLEYGLAGKFSTKQIIEDAIHENPRASVYIKIHPDVLSGKKDSDIRADDIPRDCTVIDEDVNPISLLKHFDKVYTKTSGMGFEALLLGKQVICYGLPYYAGWGITEDKQLCDRRTKRLSVEEVFAGAYILYTRYHNPYKDLPSDIIGTIEEIAKQKGVLSNEMDNR